MPTSTASALLNTYILPGWVLVAKELGIPTLIGVILGTVGSAITLRYKTGQERQHRREEIATNIMTTIYSFTFEVSILLFSSERNKFKDYNGTFEKITPLVSRLNEVKAVAAFHVGKKLEELITDLQATLGQGYFDNKNEEEKKRIKKIAEKHIENTKDDILKLLKLWSKKGKL